jgi:hypothetical protein
LAVKPADSASGAATAGGAGDACAKAGTIEEAGLVVWACKPANDKPAKTINNTVILISRTDLITASTKQAVKLPHREEFHKRFFEK